MPARGTDPSCDLNADPLLAGVPVHEGYKVLGGVVLYEKIGAGGMGAVYRGRHLRLDIDVAVKVMAPPAGLTPEKGEDFIRRFIREARTAARIDHTNLVRVLDVNSEGGVYYLVMQLVDGESAAERLARKGRLSEGEAGRICLAAASALAEAHAKGIVHRDVKPDNIMIDRSGKVKVTDLGLAKAYSGERDGREPTKLTRTQAVLGTPYYMAPEQFASAADLGPAADVWSLGVTLHELLTGERPWTDDNVFALVEKIRDDPPPDPRELSPDLSSGICRIIEKALCKKPEGRYADCGQMADALREHVRTLPRSRAKSSRQTARAMKPASSSVTPPPQKTLTLIGESALDEPEDVEDAEALDEDAETGELILDEPEDVEDAEALRETPRTGEAARPGRIPKTQEEPESKPVYPQWLNAKPVWWATCAAGFLTLFGLSMLVAPAGRHPLWLTCLLGVSAYLARRDYRKRWPRKLTYIVGGPRPAQDVIAEERRKFRRDILTALFVFALFVLGWVVIATLLWLTGYSPNDKGVGVHNLQFFANGRRGDYDSSIPELATLQVDSENPDTYALRGVAKALSGDVEGAMRDCEQAISLDPGCALGYAGRGLARAFGGDDDGVVRDCDRAVRLDPKSAEVHLICGMARVFAGDLSAAIRDCDQAIRIKPKMSGAYCYRGLAKAQKGDSSGALRDYGEAVRLDPRNSMPYYFRGLMKAGQGDFDGAISDYDHAIRLIPIWAKPHYYRGVAKQAKGDTRGAEQDFETARRLGYSGDE